MQILLTLIDVIFLAGAFAFLIVYALCKDIGYLLMSLISVLSVGVSMFLIPGWPLAVGLVVLLVLLIAGTGRVGSSSRRS